MERLKQTTSEILRGTSDVMDLLVELPYLNFLHVLCAIETFNVHIYATPIEIASIYIAHGCRRPVCWNKPCPPTCSQLYSPLLLLPTPLRANKVHAIRWLWNSCFSVYIFPCALLYAVQEPIDVHITSMPSLNWQYWPTYLHGSKHPIYMLEL